MKNKQVEEMAKVIFEYVDSKDRKNVYIIHSGFAEDMKTYSHNYGVAKALYNAGYKKLNENDMVLSTEQVDEFMIEQAEFKYRKNQVIEQAVKEFAEKLKKKYGKSCSEYYPLLIELTSEQLDETLKEVIGEKE